MIVDLALQTGSPAVDLALRGVVNDINAALKGIGPGSPLSGVIKGTRGNAVIVLRAGFYELKAPLVIDTDDVTLVAEGRVRLRGDNTPVVLSGERCALVGIEVESRATELTGVAVSITGDHCSLDRCRVTAPCGIGVDVDADYVAIRGCSFMDDSGHAGAGDFDMYFEDGATFGVVCGNKWSATRQFALSYNALDSMSEAANGPAAIIDVR